LYVGVCAWTELTVGLFQQECVLGVLLN
jgi:hypothetical protein